MAAPHVHQRRPFIASHRSLRRGFGIIPVITLFAIAVTICAIWTKASLSQHRDQLLREDRVQASWLADAGVRRGAARLASNAEFVGETWEVPGDQFGRRFSAAVVIRIEPIEVSPGAVRIVARASYPKDRPRVTVSKSVVFTPSLSESPL